MIYNCSDFVKTPKPPKEFLLRFDSEDQPASGDDLINRLKVFAIQHNAKLKGG
jgi:hypothetical protein